MKNKGYKSRKKSPKKENAGMGSVSGGSIASTTAPMRQEDYGSDDAHPEGSRVRIAHNSGVDSNKTGVVVDQREVKTDGRGIPTNIQGAYKPVDWTIETAVRLDDGGELITMFNDRLMQESIRIFSHEKGKGTVLEVVDIGVLVDWDNKLQRILGPERVSLKDAKYLELIRETNPVKEADEYSDDPEDVEVGSNKKKKRKKKNGDNDKIDEGVIGIAAISGTFRGARISDEYYKNLDVDLDSMTLDDLLEDDEDYEENNDEPEEYQRGTESETEQNKTPDGSDYVNVPSPSNTVLTNQSKQTKPQTKPLSTWDEEPGDGASPDGDSKDMAPVDAPDPLNWKELETDRHNTRDVGNDGEDTRKVNKTNYADDGDSEPVSDNDTSDSSSDKSDSTDSSDDEEKKMVNENLTLSYEDLDEELGLIMNGKSGADILFEGETGTGVSGYGEDCYGEDCHGEDGDVSETHDVGAGDVALTRELLSKLLSAVAEQSPTDKLDYIAQGLEAAQKENGDRALDVGDIDSIMGKIKDAASGSDMGGDYENGGDMGGDYENGGDEYDNEPDGQPEGGEYDDTEMEYDENLAGGDARQRSQGNRNPDGEGARDDSYGKKASRYSGSAERHEDHGGDYYDDDSDYSDEDRAAADGKRAGPEGGQEHEGKKMFMDHLGMQEEKGSGTPISSNTTKGSSPGGGSTKDLSAPKENKPGTPVGTGSKSGPGGGGGGSYGQKPTEDGGSNLLPASDRGSSLGADDNPFSNVTKDKVNPRGGKQVAESAAKRRARKQLDENILLGISAIPSTIRNVHADEYLLSEDDPDYDIKIVRKRAGMDNWWKV